MENPSFHGKKATYGSPNAHMFPPLNRYYLKNIVLSPSIVERLSKVPPGNEVANTD